MTRLALPLFALAAFGCTTYDDPPPASTMRTASGVPVVTTSAAPVGSSASAGASASRPGFGIIESISLVNAPTPASAAAGGTGAPVATGPYRLTLRMDDGAMQTMVVDSRAFLVGDRVQVLPDGRLIRA
jgi:hypothetical protein